MREYFLKPGELVAVDKPSIIKTILGSCVAVALYDVTTSVAGLNHFMLPKAPADVAVTQVGRYGDSGTKLLLEKMLRLGSEPENLQARIYGGGTIVSALSSHFDVGTLNIEAAREILERFGVRLVSERVGGVEGVHLTFLTETRNVTVRDIKSSTEGKS